MIHQPKTAPWLHQMEALQKADGKTEFGFLMEMGTGKSKVAIDELDNLFLDGVIDRVLVTSGNGSIGVWNKTQFPLHMRDDIRASADLHRWTGSWNNRDKVMVGQLLRKDSNRLKALTMNIEALSSSQRAYDIADAFVSGGRTLIVADESTTIKNPDSNRTKSMIALGRKAAVRRIMSGSSITNSPLDIWGQAEFLKPGLLDFRNFTAFRAHYAILREIRVGHRLVKVPVGYRNLDELSECIASWSFRKLKKDCLDLPEKVYTTREVELTDEQRKLYDALVRDCFSELRDSSTITAVLPIVRFTRLHQIVSGIAVADGTREEVAIKNNRVQAVLDISEEGAAPMIVWCVYKPSVRAVAAALEAKYPGKVVTYYGDSSKYDRDTAEERFQKGDVDFFVGTQATGGMGLTLTRAKTTVYYSNNFSLLLREQSEDRAHRGGLDHTHTYVDLIAPDTVDEKVINSLRNKIDIAAAVNRDGIRKWL